VKSLRCIRPFVFAALLLGPARGQAETLEQLFAAGTAAQTQGRFGDAAAAYEALLEAGVDDPDVRFNLASSYGKQGRYGAAIVQFEHVLRHSPRDDAARRGLKQAIEALGARQARERGEAIVTERPALLAAMFSSISRDALAIALWAAAWLVGLALLALLVVRAEAVRVGLGVAAALAALVAAVAGLGLGAKREFGAEGTEAVVVRDELELRAAPDPSAERVETVYEGARLRTFEREGSTYRVRLGDGREAYADASALGLL
jgi:tetratricopeptide (TPR) repeat protein